MITPNAAERLDYSQEDFQFIREILKAYAGIDLNEGKKELVYSRLAKRLRRLGMLNFADYCHVLEKDPSELLQCINALTTNVTHFFRENHHFEYLGELLKKRNPAKPFRVWSAGCSSGEEPYSIAMTCAEVSHVEDEAITILGTDLDSQILERAQLGIYRSKDVNGLDPERLRASFLRGRGQRNGQVKLQKHVRELVEYRQLNLKEPWEFEEPFDVIFCRNVMIYFDSDLKNQLFEQFHQALVPNGHLILGHSESLFGMPSKFSVVGRTIYQKVMNQ